MLLLQVMRMITKLFNIWRRYFLRKSPRVGEKKIPKLLLHAMMTRHIKLFYVSRDPFSEIYSLEKFVKSDSNVTLACDDYTN